MSIDALNQKQAVLEATEIWPTRIKQIEKVSQVASLFFLAATLFFSMKLSPLFLATGFLSYLSYKVAKKLPIELLQIQKNIDDFLNSDLGNLHFTERVIDEHGQIESIPLPEPTKKQFFEVFTCGAPLTRLLFV